MRMLLINQNPVVSKLSGLSAQKSGFEVVETPFLEEMEEGPYEVLFIDDAKLDEIDIDDVKSRSGAKRIALIYSDEESRPEGFDYYLKKPFLPTEMVDLLSEIKDDMLLPEIEEESLEEHSPEEAEGSAEEERPAELSEEESTEEEVPEPPAHEEATEMAEAEEPLTETGEEDFDALLEQLEESEALGAEAAGEAAEEKEGPEAAEPVSDEEDIPEPAEEIDFDTLIEEVEDTQPREALGEAPEDEDIEALLEGIEIPQTEEDTEAVSEDTDIGELEGLEEIEGLEELAELDEAEGGVLDEEQVNAVKELLEETAAGEEESETAAEIEEDAEVGEEIFVTEAGEEETPLPKMEEEAEEEEALSQAEREVEEPAAQTEQGDELDLISEEELAAVLGERAPAAAEEEKRAPKSESVSTEGEELLAKLAGLDPESLKKLLAGAEVTIKITFPKEV